MDISGKINDDIITKEKIFLFEKTHKIILPEEYRAYLLTLNENIELTRRGFYCVDFDGNLACGHIDAFYKLELLEDRIRYFSETPFSLPEWLIIGQNASGDFIAFNFAKKSTPLLYLIAYSMSDEHPADYVRPILPSTFKYWINELFDDEEYDIVSYIIKRADLETFIALEEAKIITMKYNHQRLSSFGVLEYCVSYSRMDILKYCLLSPT